MKIVNKFVAIATALLFIFNSFPVLTIKAYANTDEAAVSDVMLPFSASIEYSSNGYIVMGTLKDCPADATLIRTMYSTDSKTYQPCIKDWDFHLLDTDDTGNLSNQQKQICLYSNFEPFKSYLAGSLERFYIKLHITAQNGTVYKTMPVVIERGVPQPLPENLTAGAAFTHNMAVIHTRPFSYYGRYMITVREDATAQNIAALLPDTIPVEIDFYNGKNVVADGIADCPITWKNLSLPKLTAGESITIEDAAEELTVPAGTQVTTPVGIFTLNAPLYIDPLRNNNSIPMDEIRLVLNVIPEGDNPTGVLSEDREGLTMSFNRKPSGATSIRAYTLLEGESEWTEIPNTTLIKSVNSQPSAENSGYALILDNNTEPYRSYLQAKKEGNHPTPFCVGIKIEGGVYDGQQLILTWPDTYNLPCDIPSIAGQGGNEVNAGSGNNGDATAQGQRPNLPQNTDDETASPLEAENSNDRLTSAGGHSGGNSHPPSKTGNNSSNSQPLTAPLYSETDSNNSNSQPLAAPLYPETDSNNSNRQPLAAPLYPETDSNNSNSQPLAAPLYPETDSNNSNSQPLAAPLYPKTDNNNSNSQPLAAPLYSETDNNSGSEQMLKLTYYHNDKTDAVYYVIAILMAATCIAIYIIVSRRKAKSDISKQTKIS